MQADRYVAKLGELPLRWISNTAAAMKQVSFSEQMQE